MKKLDLDKIKDRGKIISMEEALSEINLIGWSDDVLNGKTKVTVHAGCSENILSKYIGKTLYGFCNGYFGRDSYENKTIVYVGEKYILTENEEGVPGVAYFKDMDYMEIEKLVLEWINNKED